jgi:hypothetical protein
MQNGRVEWRGAFLFDASIVHELVQINLDVTSMIWRFMRKTAAAPDVIADKVRLLPTGEIDGYWHPNEARWAYGSSPGVIRVHSANDAVSTNFDTFGGDRAPCVSRYICVRPAIRHILEESAPGWEFDSSYISWLPWS